MYMPVFIYSNECAAFDSSVPSDIQLMKMVTFALSVSHVYVSLHLLEQFCCLRLVGAQQQCVRSRCEGMCR
jgi:hypothetical protein